MLIICILYDNNYYFILPIFTHKMRLNYYSGFPYNIKKKLTKTREARQGDPLYKRRNRRSYRVLMHLITWKNLKNKNSLDKYENGFVVVVKPREYFNKEGNRRSDFPSELKIGENAIIYYKRKSDLKKFKPKNEWEEVIETDTKDPNGWEGHYAVNIRNAKPQIKSKITRSGDNTVNVKGKKQAGLGNYDYDYANDETMKKVCYQLSFLIWKLPNIEDYLVNIAKNKTEKYEKREIEIKRMKEMGYRNYIEQCKNHVMNFCEENDLNDLDKLQEIRAFNKDEDKPCCPLCLKTLDCKIFFKEIEQDEGRRVPGNTITNVSLFHIKCLRPGKIRHKPYNLGWGHHHCNTIQGRKGIEETVDELEEIVKNQYMWE